jgi:hypothetical protein
MCTLCLMHCMRLLAVLYCSANDASIRTCPDGLAAAANRVHTPRTPVHTGTCSHHEERAFIQATAPLNTHSCSSYCRSADCQRPPPPLLLPLRRPAALAAAAASSYTAGHSSLYKHTSRRRGSSSANRALTAASPGPLARRLSPTAATSARCGDIRAA